VIGDTLPPSQIFASNTLTFLSSAKASSRVAVIDVGLLWRIGPNIIHTSIHPLPSNTSNCITTNAMFLAFSFYPPSVRHLPFILIRQWFRYTIRGAAQVSFFLLAYAYLILHTERGAVLSPIPLGQWGDRKFPSLQF